MKRFIFLIFALLPSTLEAQNDAEAGLFAKAQQLPLVSQSVVVRVHGGEARIELTQVFANDGAEIAQADYRLHLPRGAVVTGFGFCNDGTFLRAELKEREEAARAHRTAASEGRPTAILKREGTIHPFTVYPVLAGSLQEIEVTMTLPVTTEGGRSSIRLPLDSFLGHSRLTSTIVAHIETRDKLLAVGIDGRRFEERRREKRSAELVFSSDEATDIWWASEAPPLLAAAESVPLDDGKYAIQLRLALNEGRRGGVLPSIALLVDASISMRRRGRALDAFVTRVMDLAPSSVRVLAVAEEMVEVTSSDSREVVSGLLSGAAGFSTGWSDLHDAAERIGCTSSGLRCIAITDPQVVGLPLDRSLEVLFLSDADELAHFESVLGRAALVYQPDIEPVGRLFALADELVLPVLEVQSISQHSTLLRPAGGPRLRTAQGSLLRLYLESESLRDLEVELTIDGKAVSRKVDIERIDPATRLGRSLRRGYYRSLLNDWTADYRKSRDPELKRQIVQVSLREEIPSDLTALHVAAPSSVLARTATSAPLLRLLGLLLTLAGALMLFTIGRWRP